MPDHQPIRQHIAAIGARTDTETHRIVERVHRSCWPGGTEDRTHAVARTWLRSWRPRRAVAPLQSCSCVAGRCAVCN